MKMKKQTIRIMAVVLVFVAFVCVVDSAKATSITDVYIMPEVPAVEDVITIFASGQASSRPVWITDSNLYLEGTSLELDIFFELGPFQMITPWSYSEEIGMLPAKTYELTVRTFEVPYPDSGPTDTYTTTFTVVPEPTSILLLSMGIVGVQARCRIRGLERGKR